MTKEHVEPYGEAGLSGSDIGDEGFRLAAGVTVGPPPGHTPLPEPPQPEPELMRRGPSLVGAPPPVRPELLRHDDITRDQSHRITQWIRDAMILTIIFIAIIVWRLIVSM